MERGRDATVQRRDSASSSSSASTSGDIEPTPTATRQQGRVLTVNLIAMPSNKPPVPDETPAQVQDDDEPDAWYVRCGYVYAVGVEMPLLIICIMCTSRDQRINDTGCSGI